MNRRICAGNASIDDVLCTLVITVCNVHTVLTEWTNLFCTWSLLCQWFWPGLCKLC